MSEVWSFLWNLISNTSIGDVVIIAFLLFIKFADFHYLENHVLRLDSTLKSKIFDKLANALQ